MAEHVKFRLTAAKVGVSMALMALIAGIAEKAQSGSKQVHATQSAFFLKLGAIPGETKKALKTLEVKWDKLNTQYVKLESKLSHSYYNKGKVDVTFMKIADANNAFYKIKDANNTFLKTADANSQFLKPGDTATNSQKLGGMTADAFFQGHGNVVSGAVSVNPGETQQLLVVPGGAVSVLIGLNLPGTPGGPTVTVQNNTNNTMPAVQMGDTGVHSADLKANGGTSLALGTSSAHEIQLQIFPSAGLNSIVSILIALEPNPSNQSQYSAVGQLLLGNR